MELSKDSLFITVKKETPRSYRSTGELFVFIDHALFSVKICGTRHDWFLFCMMELIISVYFARLLPELTDMEIANASAISSFEALAVIACVQCQWIHGTQSAITEQARAISSLVFLSR